MSTRGRTWVREVAGSSKITRKKIYQEDVDTRRSRMRRNREGSSGANVLGREIEIQVS